MSPFWRRFAISGPQDELRRRRAYRRRDLALAFGAGLFTAAIAGGSAETLALLGVIAAGELLWLAPALVVIYAAWVLDFQLASALRDEYSERHAVTRALLAVLLPDARRGHARWSLG